MDINKLKSERALKYDEMLAINEMATSETRDINAEEIAKMESLDKRAKELDKLIEMEERMEEIAKRKFANKQIPGAKNENKTSTVEAFRNFVETGTVPSEFRGSNGGFVFRADPLLTTTESGIINKGIAPLSILNSSGLELAQSLGVTIFTGLDRTFELPKMSQTDASSVAEGAGVGSAGASPSVIELKALNFGTSQQFSKQTLLTSSPDVIDKIINDMKAANGRKILKSLFANINVDAVDASIASTAVGLTYGNLVKLKAIDYTLGNTAFVTTPTVRAYLEQLNASSAGIKFAWDNNVVAGEKAVATAAAGANEIYFGDWSNAVIGIFGETEIIIDPYKYKEYGKVDVTVMTYADTAIQNSKAFHYCVSVSCGF